MIAGLVNRGLAILMREQINAGDKLYQSSLKMTLVGDSPLPALVVAWLCEWN
jgi:hypothetical protein